MSPFRINLEGDQSVGILSSLGPVDLVNLWIDHGDVGTMSRKLELLTPIEILIHNPMIIPNRVVRRDDPDTILNLKVA